MIINIVGTFAIRLDGSPNFSMTINTLSALVNIVLDWLFIFPWIWESREQLLPPPSREYQVWYWWHGISGDIATN